MSNRVAEHRARMKQRGYKEVRYWVPDVTSPAFAERIHREAAALNSSDEAAGTPDFLKDMQAELFAE